MMQPILIAVSGGVDSSVAAWKLKQDGYQCHAAVMQLSKPYCTEEARAVARLLEIPFGVIDGTAAFQSYVINPFVDHYLAGWTPNPCILCNRRIKFDFFLREAEKRGISRMATGHYAQIEYDSATNRYLLKKAVDATKDQSYVLYTLTQSQLAKIVFPLGVSLKNEHRSIAESFGFASAGKRESQDLCFVPDGDYAAFIEQYRGQICPAGDFVDKTGKVLGTHRGLIRYTIGQRKGLGIAAPAPYYVCGLQAEENRVVLGSESDLLVRRITAKDINLIPFDHIGKPLRAVVKVRYRQKGGTATVMQIDDKTLLMEFDEPQKGVALGQAAVMYDGDYILGGGTITAVSLSARSHSL